MGVGCNLQLLLTTAMKAAVRQAESVWRGALELLVVVMASVSLSRTGKCPQHLRFLSSLVLPAQVSTLPLAH